MTSSNASLDDLANASLDDLANASLNDLAWQWLRYRIRKPVEFPQSHNALVHLGAERRAFQPGCRSSGTPTDLGDTSGVIEVTAKLKGFAPAGLLQWVLQWPYLGRIIAEADGQSPAIKLYAGMPGPHELRLESISSGGDITTLGRTYVSAPGFVQIKTDRSFQEVFPTGMDRNRLLRRARSLTDQLFSFANLRTIWPDEPFSESLPKQFREKTEQPTTGSFIVTGRTEVMEALEGSARDYLLTVKLKGSRSGGPASGAKLYVADTPAEKDTPLESLIGKAKQSGPKFEEELTARYLAVELAHHSFRKLGAPSVDDKLARLFGEIMTPDLHLADRTIVEWYLLGVRIDLPEAFPQKNSYFDRLKDSSQDVAVSDVLASPLPKSRAAIERLAPLPFPVPESLRDRERRMFRVTSDLAYLRDPLDSYRAISQPSDDVSEDAQQRYQQLRDRPHVTYNQDNGVLIIDPWISCFVVNRVVKRIEDDRDETFAYVLTTNGDEIGWTKESNLAWFLRDNVPDVANAPESTVTLDGLKGYEEQIAQIYNRVGGLFEYLSGQLSEEGELDPRVMMAFYRNEGGFCDVSDRDGPLLRFENHVFWEKWGQAHPDQFNQHFDYGSDEDASNHQFCESGNCLPDEWRTLHPITDSKPSVCSNTFQDRQYAALAVAERIADRDTALKACSVGYPQIMGFNCNTVGYGSPSSMFDAFAAAERAQVLALFDYFRGRERNGESSIKLASITGNETRDDDYWTDLSAVYNGSEIPPAPREDWGNHPSYASKLREGFQAGTTVLRGTGNGEAGEGGNQVCFTGGDCLPIVEGPEAKSERHWLLSDDYWDPNDSRNPLLATDGKHRAKKIAKDFTVDEFVYQSVTKSVTSAEKARIDPAFARFLQEFQDEINTHSEDELEVAFTSGYRSFAYNRHTDGWPMDIANVERVIEKVRVDGEYKWKVKIRGQDTPEEYGDVTKSEHCSGRAADVYLILAARPVTSEHAYLRDPDDEYKPIKQENPPDSSWNKADDIEYDEESHTWEIQEGTRVKISERDVRPSGDTVVKVVSEDETEIGWTNLTNLGEERSSEFTTLELAKIALETPDKHNIEGVNPCDTRIGADKNESFVHIDIKPRSQPSGGAVWDYGSHSGKPDEVQQKRNKIDEENDC